MLHIPTPDAATVPAMRMQVDVDACLVLRPARLECGLCVQACPADAIAFDFDEGSLTIDAACLACGRCAARCPSEAITLAAPGALDAAAQGAGPEADLFIECARVPASHRRRAAQVVTCLGALSPAGLLASMAAGRRPVLLDRGWCAECPAGRRQALTTLDAVSDAAHDAAGVLGVDANASQAGLPCIETAPLPERLALPAPTATGVAAMPMARRAFFGTLRAGARAVAAAVARPRWTRTRAACRPSITLRAALERRRAALATLATRAGRSLPARAFPLLSVHASCCHEGVCAAACPSGALQLVDADEGEVGLDFDAAQCLGCGLCVALCPQHALSLAQAGPDGAALAAAPAALVRHPLRACSRCHERFVAHGNSALCPRCAMTRDQARDLFGALRTRSAEQATPRLQTTHGEEHE